MTSWKTGEPAIAEGDTTINTWFEELLQQCICFTPGR